MDDNSSQVTARFQSLINPEKSGFEYRWERLVECLRITFSAIEQEDNFCVNLINVVTVEISAGEIDKTKLSSLRRDWLNNTALSKYNFQKLLAIFTVLSRQARDKDRIDDAWEFLFIGAQLFEDDFLRTSGAYLQNDNRAQKGGEGKSKASKQSMEEAIRLLETSKPENGWKSHDTAFDAIRLDLMTFDKKNNKLKAASVITRLNKWYHDKPWFKQEVDDTMQAGVLKPTRGPYKRD